MKEKIINILLYIWQLPQNILGLIIITIYGANKVYELDGIKYRYCSIFPGGISLGNYIIVYSAEDNIIKHEYGHTIQSKCLGPLYLIVIGLPSIIWAGLYGNIIPYTKNGYYKFYTEKWADKLAGIIRK